MRKSENTFYDKYFFHIWIIVGYFGTLFIALLRGAHFVKSTDYLFFLSLLIASPFLAIFWYCLFMFTELVVSFFWEGIKEKDPSQLFAAFWIGIGLISFISSTLFF